MERSNEAFGTLAEEYHVASRNQLGRKCAVNQHQVHYSEDVQRLATEAPLRLEGYPRVLLPALPNKIVMPVDDAIHRRCSARSFNYGSISAEQLRAILYCSNAVREVNQVGDSMYYRRQVPNSGNLGSVEVFPIVLNVDGIAPGIYHFDSVSHDLAQIRNGQFSGWLSNHVFYQLEFSKAAVALVLIAAIGRLSAKYGLRAHRLAFLDTGHVSQNIYLMCTAMELQVCATAGFIDCELDRAVGVDGIEMATTLVSLVGPSAD